MPSARWPFDKLRGYLFFYCLSGAQNVEHALSEREARVEGSKA